VSWQSDVLSDVQRLIGTRALHTKKSIPKSPCSAKGPISPFGVVKQGPHASVCARVDLGIMSP